MAIYQKKATEIIKESIKTAVFIDEKAWNPFEKHSFEDGIQEHDISKNLYENFKKEGISLDIHRFNQGEENLALDNNLKKYLFKERDLVLLDWDLIEGDLNISTLKLLNDVIKQPHIHFCVIYTSTPVFDTIINKIYSYFSGFSSKEYSEINEILEPFNDSSEIKKLISGIDLLVQNSLSLQEDLNNIDSSILSAVRNIVNKEDVDCFRAIKIAFDKQLPKSEEALFYNKEIVALNNSENTLIINNTIVTIFKKEDNKPDVLIENFSKYISNDKSKSFLKILGLNIQNEFAKQGAFISPDILNISFETFMYHRRQMIEKQSEQSFENFIKEILLENAKLNLSSSQLTIIEKSFLDEVQKSLEINPNEKQIASINSFYNGFKITQDKYLGFGDIFKDKEGSFYLCITALCDCLVRDNISSIKFKYFFVEGFSESLSTGLDKKDGGFMSYINDICIFWTKDTKGQYVKPFQLYVPEPKIKDGSLVALDWVEKCQVSHQLEYVFTLKQNYAQRIANHAFTHPVRVGVDFAVFSSKKKKG